MVPMADLAPRWGVTPNTVSRRLAFLKIKPIRQGNFRFLTAEQLELAEALHHHILSGKPQESFPRPDGADASQVVRQVRPQVPAHVAVQVEQLASVSAAIAAALQPPADPLRRARGLAEAADSGLVLTNEDLSGLLGQGVTGWRDGHESYGYAFRRHQQGRQVLWTVTRVLGAGDGATLPPAAVSKGSKRAPGFVACLAPVVEAEATVLSRLELPRW